jgi:hypothetical protein
MRQCSLLHEHENDLVPPENGQLQIIHTVMPLSTVSI